MDKKQYEGSAYIGVVGGENEVGICRDSIERVQRRGGDLRPRFIRATKGYEARQMHLNSFYYDTKLDFCFLMDHDMIHQANELEVLRSHKLPFVSGFYTRRGYPTYPIWFEPIKKGGWPQRPWTKPVEKGRLHKIGASGWGCILVHRDVLTATLPILKGEDWVLEDDMDVWPYDLPKVMGAVNGIRRLVEDRVDAKTLRAALKTYSQTLSEEIRPLRGDKSTVVGSDIRFPWYAYQAGFQLWGDPDVSCGHIINYPIGLADYENTPAEMIDEFDKRNTREIRKRRKELAAIRAELTT